MTRLIQTALAATVLCALFSAVLPADAQRRHCPTGDCIHHETASQAQCTEEEHGPERNAGWDRHGLSTQIDQRLAGGDVVAYKIQWSNGGWSSWFVTGVNDLDRKYDTRTNEMRRMWAYFTDHRHKRIVCR